MITTLTPFIRRLPSWLYKLGAQSYIDKEFPRHVFIETTATCNLSCSYCPREKVKADMDFNLFKSIVDECNWYGPRSYSLHLFGEPLLYPHIIEAINYIKAYDKDNTVLLTTNGTLLNQFAERLLECRVDRIIWSWRKNNFSLRTIEILKRIGMVRLLIEETPKEEFEVWSKFPRVEIKHLHNYGGKIDLSKWKNSDGMGTLERRDALSGLASVETISNGSDLSRYPCYHLWLAPAVRFNGDIVICCADPHGESSVGKYGEISLAEFWRGNVLKRLREEHLNNKPTGICVGCNVWSTYPDLFFNYQKKCNHKQ